MEDAERQHQKTARQRFLALLSGWWCLQTCISTLVRGDLHPTTALKQLLQARGFTRAWDKHQSGFQPRLHRVGLAVRVSGRSTGEEFVPHHCPAACLSRLSIGADGRRLVNGAAVLLPPAPAMGRGSFMGPHQCPPHPNVDARINDVPPTVRPMLQATEAAAASQMSTASNVDWPKLHTGMRGQTSSCSKKRSDNAHQTQIIIVIPPTLPS